MWSVYVFLYKCLINGPKPHKKENIYKMITVFYEWMNGMTITLNMLKQENKW